MELIREKWDRKDLQEFQNYLVSLSNPAKIEWTRNIINTNYPVLAIKTPTIREIAKEIRKGNYLAFLDADLHEYYDNVAVNGEIISSIKDFATFKKYLLKYSKKVDNWASCDLIKFNVNSKNKEDFITLSNELIGSSLPFERRLGIDILFKFVDKDYISHIFRILNSFYNETEYYVNMALAWLFCDCFIKCPDETKTFLKTHKLNKFVINKGISKCRDSFRVAKEDKEWLLQFKEI